MLQGKQKETIRWNHTLAPFLERSFRRLAVRKRLVADSSPWWWFNFEWSKNISRWVSQFIEGVYRFEPMKVHVMPDEVLTMWSYRDRLFIRTLLFLIKPTFQHILSPRCLHLKGPVGVQSTIDLVQKALQSGKFHYFIRTDIKSYYASVDQTILLHQLKRHFQDVRLLNYLEQVVTIPVEQDGVIKTARGIQRRSSLSPFFGALYLTEVDKAFEHRVGVYCLRFMDDLLILAQTRRQFAKAKKRLHAMLAALKLKVSPHKTKQGTLSKGFHFLGIQFQSNTPDARTVSRVQESVAQTQTPQNHWTYTLHERCYVRALTRVIALKNNSVHPENIQYYLVNWLRWWKHACPSIHRALCLPLWVQRTARDAPNLAWIGRGLLLGCEPLASHG